MLGSPELLCKKSSYPPERPWEETMWTGRDRQITVAVSSHEDLGAVSQQFKKITDFFFFLTTLPSGLDSAGQFSEQVILVATLNRWVGWGWLRWAPRSLYVVSELLRVQKQKLLCLVKAWNRPNITSTGRCGLLGAPNVNSCPRTRAFQTFTCTQIT